MNTTKERNIAKTALIEALKTSGGDTKNEEVVAAIEQLASLNPQNAEHTQYVVIMPIIIAARSGFWYRALYRYGNG